MPSSEHVDKLRAGAALAIRFGTHLDSVMIASDGSADVAYTVDGTTATGATPTKITAGAASEVQVASPTSGPTQVSLFSSGTPTVSVCVGGHSLSLPAHAKGKPDSAW